MAIKINVVENREDLGRSILSDRGQDGSVAVGGIGSLRRRRGSSAVSEMQTDILYGRVLYYTAHWSKIILYRNRVRTVLTPLIVDV